MYREMYGVTKTREAEKKTANQIERDRETRDTKTERQRRGTGRQRRTE